MQVVQGNAAQRRSGRGATEEEVAMSAWHLGEGSWNGGRGRLGGSWPVSRTVSWVEAGSKEVFPGTGGGDLTTISSRRTQVH